MTSTHDVLYYSFGAVFVFALIMIAVSSFQNPLITGHATSAITTSNVTINSYYAIDLHNNFTRGILFGNVSALPATDINATSNYDAGSGINGTTYIANVSTDSNANVEFCLSANSGLRSSGGDVIGLGNETYSNSTTSINITHPSQALQVGFTTTATKASAPVAAGGSTYWRFWLDIPAAQAAGVYNNSVTVGGVVSGQAC